MRTIPKPLSPSAASISPARQPSSTAQATPGQAGSDAVGTTSPGAARTSLPSADRFSSTGALGAAHASAPAHGGMLRELLRDLNEGMSRLKAMPAAVSVLGSARVRSGDGAYELARSLGDKLARAGVPVRTGAGPGIMGAAPRGYLEGRTALGDRDAPVPQRLLPGSEAPDAAEDDLRTQGFNIILPHEQAVDAGIEHHMAIKHFPYRKLMLFENTRSLITMPGGYGTLDEMFELWVMPHRDPMITVDTRFFGPIFDAMTKVARDERSLISDQQWARMTLTDDLDEVVRASSHTPNVSGFEEHPDVLAERLASELKDVFEQLARTPPSVTFLGAKSLKADDPALLVLEEAAARLSAQGHGARVAGDRTVAEAVARGSERSGKRAHAFPRRTDASIADLVDVKTTVSDVITQKQALTRGIEGMIAGPGDLETLGEVFTFLCEVQCGKVPKVPIVLVGKDYWQPIFDAIKTSMLEGERATISPEDLDLVTITDDPDVVVAAFQNARSTPIPGQAAAGKPVTTAFAARLERSGA